MSNNTETKPKFTAVMVDEDTKNTLKSLREESNLTEKELMSLITQKAIAHKDEILAEAAKINEAHAAAKEAKKKERIEANKLAQKEVRAAARLILEDRKNKAASATVE